MFVIVSKIIDDSKPMEEIFPETIKSFKDNKILYIDIPAHSELSNGRILARYINDKEFYKEFIIESQKDMEEYIENDKLVKKYMTRNIHESNT